MKNLVKDASMGPLREALKQGIEITKLKKEDMRPVILQVRESTMHIQKTFSMSPQLDCLRLFNLFVSYRTLRMHCKR
jgi:hypothetical protein